MRMIDADALKKDWHMGLGSCNDCQQDTRRCQLDVDFTRMDICGMIDDAPTIGGWISVKDKLPEIDEDVLILYESKVSHETGYAITCLKDSFYFGSTPIPYQTPQWSQPWQYFRENNVITHWMPLPEPPKEDEDGKRTQH